MDYHLLNLGSSSSLVRAVGITAWGTQVRIDCIYGLVADQKEYQLIFSGCSKLVLDLLPQADYEQEEAALLGISLGQAEGRQPAILTTDLFEMQITYSRFQCTKNW